MYEIGKIYRFQFKEIYIGKDGNEYLHLSDPNNPKLFISVKPYSFQTDWYDTTSWLDCYCKKQDIYGRFQFELFRETLLNYLYVPNLGHYQYFTIDRRIENEHQKKYFQVSDPYGFTQLFFPHDDNFSNQHKVGDEILLDVIAVVPSTEGKNNAYLELCSHKEIVGKTAEKKEEKHPETVIRNEGVVSIGVEDEHAEFKSSIAFPAGTNKEDMPSQLAVLMKSIAGFMNKEGGVLYIGVNDSGEPYKDISEEYQYLNDDENDNYQYHAKEDHYKLKLINKIHKDLGGYAASLANVRLEKANDVTYAAIDVKKADSIIWYQNTELFVRCGNSTRRMFGDNITKFILSRTNEKQFDTIANKPEIIQEEAEISQEPANTEIIAKSTTAQARTQKQKAWRYISLYKDGQWMFTKESVGSPKDLTIEVPIPSDVKKQVMMIAHTSGNVHAVELKELLYGTGRKKNTLISTDTRRNNGVVDSEDPIVNVFCMKKGGLLLIQSEVNGQVKIKAHNMEAVKTHKQIGARSGKMIPEGTLTHIAPIEAESIEMSAIEAMGIVVKDYKRYHENGVDREKLQGKYQELIDSIFMK